MSRCDCRAAFPAPGGARCLAQPQRGAALLAPAPLLSLSQGIYRVNGVKTRVEKLCQAFENGKELVELSQASPHDISNVLKLYLRQVLWQRCLLLAGRGGLPGGANSPNRTRPHRAVPGGSCTSWAVWVVRGGPPGGAGAMGARGERRCLLRADCGFPALGEPSQLTRRRFAWLLHRGARARRKTTCRSAKPALPFPTGETGTQKGKWSSKVCSARQSRG